MERPWQPRHARIAGAFALAYAVSAGGASAQEPRLEVGENVHVSTESPDVVHVEPAITASPTDPSRLVAASMVVRDPHSQDFQDSWGIVAYASRDGGRSWSRRPLPGLPADWVAGDVWLAWSADDVVYLSCVVSESMLRGKPVSTWAFRSTDGGWTWSEPERDIFVPGTTQDHPVIAWAARADGSPVVYGFGSVASKGAEGIELTVLDAASHRFRPLDPYLVNRPTVNLGNGVVLLDGGLLFTYFTMPEIPRGYWAVHIDPTGRRTELRLRKSIVPVGFPTLAVDRSHGAFSGRAYAAWVEGADERDERDLRVLVSSSDEGGRTWSAPRRVHRHAVPTQRTLPAIAVNDQGVVAVSWMDWRSSPDRSDCPELYWAASTDGGASFQPEVRISTERACFGTAANGGAARRWRLGGGDYLVMTAAADGSFHPIWSDGRTGVSQIWTAAIRRR